MEMIAPAFNELTVMSYNVQMLSLPFTLSLNTWTRKKALIEYIDALDEKHNVDVLVLNEVFMAEFSRMLREEPISDRFPYATHVLDIKAPVRTAAEREERASANPTRDPTREPVRTRDDETIPNLEGGQAADGSKAAPSEVPEHATLLRGGTGPGQTRGGNEEQKDEDNDVTKESTAADTEYKHNSYHHPHTSRPVPFDSITGTKRFYQMINGGVVVLSKHPIVSAHALVYSHGSFPDSLSTKGAILTKLDFNGRLVNVVATHLEAGDSAKSQKIRILQMKELSDWIYRGSVSAYVDREEPLFFVGDFNMRYEFDGIHLNYILSKDVLNGRVTAELLETTYDSSLNDYVRLTEKDKYLMFRYTLDYIVVGNDSKVEVVRPQTAIQTPFKKIPFIKFFLGFIPYYSTFIHHPSDHFPIYSIFRIL